MKVDYKLVHVYISKDNNLILIPTSFTNHGTMKEIDIVNELKYPYTDEQLENNLFKAIEQCHSMKPEESGGSIIEKFLNVKGYAKAIQNKRMIHFSWQSNKGYSICPTEKKQGYSVLSEIPLGKVIEKGSLALAFKQAIELSC